MMHAKAEFTKTKNVELTLTLTMTVEDWRVIATELPTKYPCWKLSEVITSVLEKALGQIDEKREFDK